jgi:hypothetical protein
MSQMHEATPPIGCNPIIFNHIPKAGGTSLIRFYESIFGKKKCFRHRKRDPLTDKHSPSIESLKKEEVERYMFFAGHFSYGYHALVGRSPFYIGVVRDPIERIVSDYFFNREAGRQDLKRIALQFTLDEYILDKLSNPKSNMSRSAQIEILTGEADCKNAMKVVGDQYLLACTTEQLDRCQRMLADLYARPDLSPVRANTTKSKPKSQVSDDVVAKVRNQCSEDYEFLWKIDEYFESFAWH